VLKNAISPRYLTTIQNKPVSEQTKGTNKPDPTNHTTQLHLLILWNSGNNQHTGTELPRNGLWATQEYPIEATTRQGRSEFWQTTHWTVVGEEDKGERGFVILVRHRSPRETTQLLHVPNRQSHVASGTSNLEVEIVSSLLRQPNRRW